MYIEKLTMHNFKRFEELKIYFHPQMTVLVGANGSGKTTVIEGVAIALSTLFAKMDGIYSLSIEKRQARLKSYVAGSIEDVQPQYPVEISAEAKTDSGMVSWKRSLNTSKGKTTMVDAKEMIQMGHMLQESVRSGDTETILPLFAYYGTGRLWDYHRIRNRDSIVPNNRLRGYESCMDGTSSIKLMMNWMKKMTIRQYQNMELGKGEIPELRAVYSAMEMCYQKITGYEEVKVQYNMGIDEPEIAYRDESGSWMRIPVNQLSDGYKSTISLVADMAYRMAVLNPQLMDEVCTETDGIVLIDEVDLHLHPAWQQRILGDLMDIFPKVQFIVTTHAPAVISTAQSENIVLLNDQDVSIPSEQVYGRDTNTIISSVMGASDRVPEIRDLFRSFYGCIDEEDVERAEHILRELRTRIGENDHEITGCNVKLQLLRARKKK